MRLSWSRVLALVLFAAVALWLIAWGDAQLRNAPPVALCPRADTIIVRHRMSSSGWPDSTVHEHVTPPTPEVCDE